MTGRSGGVAEKIKKIEERLAAAKRLRDGGAAAERFRRNIAQCRLAIYFVKNSISSIARVSSQNFALPISKKISIPRSFSSSLDSLAYWPKLIVMASKPHSTNTISVFDGRCSKAARYSATIQF